MKIFIKSIFLLLILSVGHLIISAQSQKGFVYLNQEETKNQAVKKVLPTPVSVVKKQQVIIQLFTNIKGIVNRVKIKKGSAVLANASEIAAKQWEFRPLKKKGHYVKMVGIIIFTFTNAKIEI